MSIEKLRWKQFIENDSNIKKAEKVKPANAMILVELFQYRESSVLLDEATAALDDRSSGGKIEFYPYAKVLKARPDSIYEVGDIVKLQYDLTRPPRNRTKERDAIIANNDLYPKDYQDPGEIFEGGILDLKKRYMFCFNILDKNEMSIDNGKLILPTHYIECAQDKDLIK